jgi:hypothetical protein
LPRAIPQFAAKIGRALTRLLAAKLMGKGARARASGAFGAGEAGKSGK